jgi:CubicO group peptidase (beta-lactamase class C family)
LPASSTVGYTQAAYSGVDISASKMQFAINRISSGQTADLRTIVEAHLGATFPALSIAVLHRGAWLAQANAGWIDPETRQVPVTSETLFDLASVTKLFTETAFLQLVSSNKIQLDDPLIEVIPAFGASGPRPLDGGQDPHTREMLPTPDDVVGKTIDPALVTFRHLLTHTSGLAPWRDVFNASGQAPPSPDEPDPIPRDERWAQSLAALCYYPFVGQPGEAVRYSDLGVMLLGEATARLHGTDHVGAAIRFHVTQPLGLESPVFNPVREFGIDRTTTAPTEYDDLWRKRRCWGEVHDENACGLGGIAGHAGLFAKAADVALFGQAWLARDQRLSIAPELMSDAVREHRRNGFRFGLGWMLKAFAGSSAGDRFSMNAFGHTGFTGTSLWIDPEKQLVVACLTNRVYPGRGYEGILPFRRALHDLFARSL